MKNRITKEQFKKSVDKTVERMKSEKRVANIIILISTIALVFLINNLFGG